jgi:hypothetical protein
MGGSNVPQTFMPKHVTIPYLNGVKHSAADLADPANTVAGNITISLGDNIVTRKSGPLLNGLDACRRAIEEALVVQPVALALYGVKSDVAAVANNTAIDADSIGITLGSGVVPLSTTVQLKARVKDAARAWLEGLA